MVVVVLEVSDGVDDTGGGESSNSEVAVLVPEPGGEGSRVGASNGDDGGFREDSVQLVGFKVPDEVGKVFKSLLVAEIFQVLRRVRFFILAEGLRFSVESMFEGDHDTRKLLGGLDWELSGGGDSFASGFSADVQEERTSLVIEVLIEDKVSLGPDSWWGDHEMV